MILFLKITEMKDADARVNNLQNISVLLLKLFIARPRWQLSSVVRMSVFGRRTFPDLCLIYGRQVTTLWVNSPLWVSQLSLPSVWGRWMNNKCIYMEVETNVRLGLRDCRLGLWPSPYAGSVWRPSLRRKLWRYITEPYLPSASRNDIPELINIELNNKIKRYKSEFLK